MRCLAALAVAALLFAPAAASADASADAALERAEAAARAHDWASLIDALAGVSPLGLLDDWRDADARLLALAGDAEAAGAMDGLAAIVGRLADLRSFALPDTDPAVARTHALAGDLLVAAGRPVEAAARLQRADAAFDRLDPRLPAEQAAALLRLAEAFAAEALPEEAARALVKGEALFAAADDPRRSDAARRAGEALRLLGRPGEAAALAEAALAAAPSAGEASARLALELGEARAALGDYEAARDAYLRALDADGDAAFRLRAAGALADLLAGFGERDGAIAALEAALAGGPAATPDALVAQNRLAGLLLEADRPAEALAAWRAVLAGVEALGLDDVALTAARASLFTNAARALVALGRGPEAADLAARAHAASLLLGTAGDDLVATLLVHAEALALEGDLDAAGRRFAEAVALAPVGADRPVGLLAARDAARFDLFRLNDAAAAAGLLRPAVATFDGAAAPAGRRPEEGRETRGEIARLLVAALWRMGPGN